ERALECRGVVRLAQRFEVADQEADDLVAGGRPGSAHLIRNAEGAQRFFEWRPQRGRAAKEDREVVIAEVRERGVDAFDFSSAEERLVERIAFVRDDHRWGRDRGHRAEL